MSATAPDPTLIERWRVALEPLFGGVTFRVGPYEGGVEGLIATWWGGPSGGGSVWLSAVGLHEPDAEALKAIRATLRNMGIGGAP